MKNNTYFCDIDGTVFKHRLFDELKTTKPEVIKSTKELLIKWYNEGHHIVMTTARPKDLRNFTSIELFDNGIPHNQLVMGISRGIRFLINDMDPDKDGKRAHAINLYRDKGFDLNID